VTGSRSDTPGVVVHPPIVFAATVLAAVGLDALRRGSFAPPDLAAPLGIAIVAVSLVWFVVCVREFRRTGTAIRPDEPTTVLIRTGPYTRSRNPVYASMVLLQAGLAVWTDNAWMLGTLVPAVAVIRWGVIAREESYLERKFGEDYLEYCRRVRRWL
jgi:protein-S-isoprenylcysteine O-methyltransferase Ste14